MALALAEEIRSLAPEAAMFDGRTWTSLPGILICPGDALKVALQSLASNAVSVTKTTPQDFVLESPVGDP